MNFIDTHAHLHFPDYDQDRQEVMARAEAAGISTFINVGTDVASSRKSLELANLHKNVYATAGIHPHDAKDADEQSIHEIAQILKDPRVVAIGEVGLDFFRDISPREKQEQVLRAFIMFHKITSKPLILHCRDAYEDLIALLKRLSST